MACFPRNPLDGRPHAIAADWHDLRTLQSEHRQHVCGPHAIVRGAHPSKKVGQPPSVNLEYVYTNVNKCKTVLQVVARKANRYDTEKYYREIFA
jgi:hypothetical protein